MYLSIIFTASCSSDTEMLRIRELIKKVTSLVQVKILVPNSTAGMIIGKGGNFIKQMKEESGSYIQISQKAKDQTLQERCITVIGKSVLWI
jgi:transcription antitermination factor NusA-like protein